MTMIQFITKVSKIRNFSQDSGTNYLWKVFQQEINFNPLNLPFPLAAH